MPFAGDETDVGGMRRDVLGDQPHGPLYALLAVAGRGDDRADHRVQAAERLLDEGDAEVGGGAEVPVEGRRGDADLAGDLAQTQAAQALLLQQSQGRVQEGLSGLLLLGLPNAEGVTHTMQLTTVLWN